MQTYQQDRLNRKINHFVANVEVCFDPWRPYENTPETDFWVVTHQLRTAAVDRVFCCFFSRGLKDSGIMVGPCVLFVLEGFWKPSGHSGWLLSKK